VVPVYIENIEAQAMEKFVAKYEQYSPQTLQRIHFVFVDDCSPKKVEITSSKLNYTLARISDNIKWNQGGARNLGVMLAKSSKLILTDLDHTFPEKTLLYLLNQPIPKAIYFFNRIKDRKKIHPHPNTFFCTKSLFYKALGVDESFCGNYGYEDIYFIELQKRLKTKIRTIRRHHILVREHKELPHEKQHNLIRDTTVNKALLEEKRKYLETKDPFRGHSRIHLNFHWEIYKENFLSPFD